MQRRQDRSPLRRSDRGKNYRICSLRRPNHHPHFAQRIRRTHTLQLLRRRGGHNKIQQRSDGHRLSGIYELRNPASHKNTQPRARHRGCGFQWLHKPYRSNHPKKRDRDWRRCICLLRQFGRFHRQILDRR